MNIKYLENGRMVHLKQVVEGGFLVNPIYKRNGELEIIEHKTKFVKLLFDEKSIPAVSEDLERAEKRLKTIQEEYDNIRKAKNEMEVCIETMKKENLSTFTLHGQYSQLKTLRAFLENKIKFVAVETYNSFEIKEFNEEAKIEDRYDDHKLKLVTLCGNTKGNLEWNLNTWSDGSGGFKKIYLFETVEEAILYVQDRINEKEMLSRDDLNLAAEYGLKIKSSLLESAIEEKIRDAKKNSDREVDNLKKAESQLAVTIANIRTIQTLPTESPEEK